MIEHFSEDETRMIKLRFSSNDNRVIEGHFNSNLIIEMNVKFRSR